MRAYRNCTAIAVGSIVAGVRRRVRARNGTRLQKSGYGGVPVVSSCETAVRSCAGGNGFVIRMLFGTP